jgi:hypothetical protein
MRVATGKTCLLLRLLSKNGLEVLPQVNSYSFLHPFNLLGILQSVSLEQLDFSIKCGNANAYVISHSLKFSKLLFELLSEHVPFDKSVLDWLCMLFSCSFLTIHSLNRQSPIARIQFPF